MNYQEIDKDWNSEKKNILNGRLRCQAATFVSLFINRVAVEEVGLPIKDYFIWGDDTEYTNFKKVFLLFCSFKSGDAQNEVKCGYYKFGRVYRQRKNR